MPAKSIIETRIRNRLEAARMSEKREEAEVERLRRLLKEGENDLQQVRRDIESLEELIAPEAGSGSESDDDNGSEE